MTNDTAQVDSNDIPVPWYADGLAFRCTGCGDCCTGAPGVVWVNDDELRAIADYLGEAIGEIVASCTHIVEGKRSLREFDNGDCTFFNGYTRRCKIYPVRPVQCRTWPFWESHLASPTAWANAATSCPGMRPENLDGVPLVPLETIQRQAAMKSYSQP